MTFKKYKDWEDRRRNNSNKILQDRNTRKWNPSTVVGKVKSLPGLHCRAFSRLRKCRLWNPGEGSEDRG